MFGLKKSDFFASGNNHELINRKSTALLRTYTTRFGNIKPRKYTGNGVKHQKMVRQAIIRARELGVTPYTK